MYRHKPLIFLLALLVGSLSSCNFVDRPPSEIEGWKPLYGTRAEMTNVFTDAPQSILQPGKIYLFPPFIYINDIGKGIHVIDNSDNRNPQKIAFLHIPGNVDLAIKNQVLYADNGPDLLAIDITDVQNITVLKRMEDMFPINEFPPQQGYFECYDPTKGLVIGWEKATLEDPECYR